MSFFTAQTEPRDNRNADNDKSRAEFVPKFKEKFFCHFLRRRQSQAITAMQITINAALNLCPSSRRNFFVIFYGADRAKR